VATRSRARAKRTGVETLLLRQPWDELIPHLLRAGADADVAIERLKAYMRELCEWNRNISNLISGNDEQRFVERHLLESLQPAYWLKEAGGDRWLDLGSGGGLPALPLIIAGVGKEWTLVESRRTKTLFMRRVVEALGLPGITVVNERIENVVAGGELGARFDGFTSRATMTLAPTLLVAAPMLVSGGSAFLWKGSGREEEMKDSRMWLPEWQLEGILGIGAGVNVVCRFKRN
jgi:16S rRNA (guanine(527)-N(7))-methyltransferase RsmG